jgi:phage baseplate assembly protein W
MMQRDILGKGLRFPIKPGADGRLSYLGGPEKVEQSIWLILNTSAGERVMRPTFGSNLHDYVFRPNDAATRGVLAQRTRDALLQWEPRIDVLDVRVDQDPGVLQQVLIRIDYRLRSNNAVYNLVYPFFLAESGG